MKHTVAMRALLGCQVPIKMSLEIVACQGIGKS